jgi:hypothetical protein
MIRSYTARLTDPSTTAGVLLSWSAISVVVKPALWSRVASVCCQMWLVTQVNLGVVEGGFEAVDGLLQYAGLVALAARFAHDATPFTRTGCQSMSTAS